MVTLFPDTYTELPEAVRQASSDAWLAWAMAGYPAPPAPLVRVVMPPRRAAHTTLLRMPQDTGVLS